MFCGKCGSFFEGDQPLCDKCAAEQAAEQTFGNVSDSAPADDAFELNTSAPQKAPKKSRKKRGLVTGIVAASVAVAVGVGAIFGGPYIKAFFNRTFQKPEKYFVDVQKTAIAKYSDEISGAYGELMNMYYTDDEGDATGLEAELKITVGDELMALLESNLGTEMDLDFLKDIRLTANVNSQDSLTQMIVAASLGKTQILSADLIMDLAESQLFAAIPELNKQYLMVDISDLDLDLDIDEMKESLAEAAAMSDKVAAALPSESVVNELINTYAGVALSCIDDVEKSNETLEVGDASQKVVALRATISEEDLYEMGHAILNEAKDDENLEQIIKDLSVALGELNGAEMDLYPQFQEAIEMALEDMEYESEDFSDENYIEWISYVDMQGEVRGHDVTVYSEDEDEMEIFSWLTASKGKTTYIEGEIPSAMVELNGEKVEVKGGTEGFYELSVAGEELGTLEFETVTDTRTTLRLIPGAAIMDQILSESGLPTALLSGNVALELSFGENEAGADFLEVGVLAANKTLVSVGLSAKKVNGGNVTVPSDAIEVTDTDALTQWLSNVDFEQLMDGLERAGIDQGLLDQAQDYIDMFENLGLF
jgi:hypothetical protein